MNGSEVKFAVGSRPDDLDYEDLIIDKVEGAMFIAAEYTGMY